MGFPALEVSGVCGAATQAAANIPTGFNTLPMNNRRCITSSARMWRVTVAESDADEAIAPPCHPRWSMYAI